MLTANSQRFAIHQAMKLPTLHKLESIVRVLVQRYGRTTTLGELLAATIGIRRIAEGEPISVTDLAELSGESTSNVSRWLGKVPHVELAPDQSDQRRKLIQFTDPDRAFRHLPAIQEVFQRQEPPSSSTT